MNKEIRRLWIILAGAVALLALNALVAATGWSPIEPIVQEQIRKRSKAADAISVGRMKRLSDAVAEAQVQDPQRQRQHTRQRSHRQIEQKGLPEVTAVKQAEAPEATFIAAPVAPQKPVAPQISPRPVAPLPPSYILYYPDGTVRYISQPVFPHTLVYPAHNQ